tara:strand:- start:19 stop:504 length:486 start_codon:yes stop_codon:yes gene_type:complete
MSSPEEEKKVVFKDPEAEFNEPDHEKVEEELQNEMKPAPKLNPVMVLLKNVQILVELSISRGSFRGEETELVGKVYNEYAETLTVLETQSKDVNFPINMLVNQKKILDLVIQRGKFLPRELTTVGQVYNGLVDLITKASTIYQENEKEKQLSEDKETQADI